MDTGAERDNELTLDTDTGFPTTLRPTATIILLIDVDHPVIS